MKRYGLIGKTLGHSFSRQYFGEKFAAEHIDARYDNFEMPSADGLKNLIELVKSTQSKVLSEPTKTTETPEN